MEFMPGFNFMPNHCRLLAHTYRIQSHHWVDVSVTA
jgi:hypothetical protein